MTEKELAEKIGMKHQNFIRTYRDGTKEKKFMYHLIKLGSTVIEKDISLQELENYIAFKNILLSLQLQNNLKGDK